MRPDMPKVLCERQRKGGGIKAPKGEQRLLQKAGLDNSPRREKMRLKWINTWHEKELSEHLSPLWRWLVSKVGRRWDDVYSELCRELKRSNTTQNRLRGRVENHVEQDIVMIDGVPCYRHTYGYLRGRRFGTPLFDYRDVLYVNPETGLLCLLKGHKNKPTTKKRTFVVVDGTHQLHQINGLWYELTLEGFKPQYINTRESIGNYAFHSKIYKGHADILLGVVDDPLDAVNKYGGYYKAVAKRQLNKREIKRWITNAVLN